MVEQLAGVASVAAVVLAYLLLLETMTAAIVLLATFTLVQWRHLCALLADPPRERGEPGPAVVEGQDQPERPSYKLGGGLARW